MYHRGDYVFLADIPRPFLCRVIDAETFSVGPGRSQMLKLAPLEGPWPADTMLIRLDHCVKPRGPEPLAGADVASRAPSRGTRTRTHRRAARGGRRHVTTLSTQPFVWTHFSRAGSAPGLVRAGAFTPYTAQLILDDALHAGRGGVLEVVVAQDCDDTALARVRSCFARLRDRGLSVDVRRGRPAAPERWAPESAA